MRRKYLNRTLLLFLVFTILGAGTALANSMYEYIRAMKMSVTINGETIASDGYLALVNRKNVPLADLQAVADKLGGYLKVDEKTGNIAIYKPNVQVTVVAKENDRSNRYIHTHHLKNNTVHDVSIRVTIDSVAHEIEDLELAFLDPRGRVLARITDKDDIVKKISTNGVTLINFDAKVNIEQRGLHTVNFSIKPKGEKQFYRVGQTQFESID